MHEIDHYPQETIELASQNVLRITVATKDWAYETPNFYLLKSDGEGVVIDSGRGTGEEFTAFLGAWEAFEKPKIRGVIVTHHHYDHKSGSQEFADLLGADVVGGDEKEQEEQELRVGSTHVIILPTPGHTKDSVSVLNNKSKALFTGDTIVAEPSSVVTDMSEYAKSLASIRDIKAKIIFPGHGRTVYEPSEHVTRYIERMKRREGHVVRALKKGFLTLEEIAKSVYPQGIGKLETTQVNAHLQKLVNEGFVMRDGNEYRLEISNN